MNPQQALIGRALITRIEHLEREIGALDAELEVFRQDAESERDQTRAAWCELWQLCFPMSMPNMFGADAIRIVVEELKRRGLTSGKAGE